MKRNIEKIHESRNSVFCVEQITLSFRNLSYYVKIKHPITHKKYEKILLNHISGFIRPNTLTALMGPSGAGKTTLLDVLANRKTSGKVTGKILFDGQELDKCSLTHYLGYVEQEDRLPEKETVYEALKFSAETRLPHGTTDDVIENVIKDTLKLLELESYANLMIGTMMMVCQWE